MKKKNFLLIGYGNMGSSFVHRIQNIFDLTVVDRSKRPPFECNYYDSMKNLKDQYDFITFAVKPYQLKTILEDFDCNLLHDQSRIISLIAGAKSEIFKKRFGEKTKVSLCMANLPVKVGKGITAVYSDEKLEFLDYLGQTIYVNSQEEIGN